MTQSSNRPSRDIIKKLRLTADPEEYKEIRTLWIEHSRAEDARDIPGLMATLTDDCVYETPQNGRSWHGKEGATAFYTELLSAFPDVHFDLQEIVIGPQGVYEEAHVTGTHLGLWNGMEPTGNPIEFEVFILFPWDREKKLFKGERVYYSILGDL